MRDTFGMWIMIGAALVESVLLVFAIAHGSTLLDELKSNAEFAASKAGAVNLHAAISYQLAGNTVGMASLLVVSLYYSLGKRIHASNHTTPAPDTSCMGYLKLFVIVIGALGLVGSSAAAILGLATHWLNDVVAHNTAAASTSFATTLMEVANLSAISLALKLFTAGLGHAWAIQLRNVYERKNATEKLSSSYGSY